MGGRVRVTGSALVVTAMIGGASIANPELAAGEPPSVRWSRCRLAARLPPSGTGSQQGSLQSGQQSEPTPPGTMLPWSCARKRKRPARRPTKKRGFLTARRIACTTAG